jgi:hypothetical protein
MAIVPGIRERVHLPLYDSIHVKAQQQLRDIERSSTLKFFVNVQGKTKLETNLQAAWLLPHGTTFEAHAMQVVISDLPPEFSDGVAVNQIQGNPPAQKFDSNLKRVMELLAEARADNLRQTKIQVSTTTNKEVQTGGTTVAFTVDNLETALKALDQTAPSREQIRPNDGTIIGRLFNNSVTTLYVGEKIMIQMPTWFFRVVAGPYSEWRITTHGEPSPTAPFRFAEPIVIDRQQNFRVEMEVPDSHELEEIQRIYGPLFMWVVLDGYMVRDVGKARVA